MSLLLAWYISWYIGRTTNIIRSALCREDVWRDKHGFETNYFGTVWYWNNNLILGKVRLCLVVLGLRLMSWRVTSDRDKGGPLSWWGPVWGGRGRARPGREPDCPPHWSGGGQRRTLDHSPVLLLLLSTEYLQEDSVVMWWYRSLLFFRRSFLRRFDKSLPLTFSFSSTPRMVRRLEISLSLIDTMFVH